MYLFCVVLLVGMELLVILRQQLVGGVQEDVGLSLLLSPCNQNKRDNGDRDKGKNVKPGKYGDGGQCIIGCVQEHAEQILRTDICRKRNQQHHHLIFFFQCRNFEQRFVDEEIEEYINYLIHCQEHHPEWSR